MLIDPVIKELFRVVWEGCLGNAVYELVEEVFDYEAFILKFKNNKELNKHLASALIKCFFKAQKKIAYNCVKDLKANSQQRSYRGVKEYYPRENHTDINHLENKIKSLNKQLRDFEKTLTVIPIPTLDEIHQILTSHASSNYQTYSSLIDRLLPFATENCPVKSYEIRLKQENNGLFQNMSDYFLREISDYEQLYHVFTTLSQAQTSSDLQRITQELNEIKKWLQEEYSTKLNSDLTSQLQIRDNSNSIRKVNPQSYIEFNSDNFLFFDSNFYSNCYTEIEKPGALVRIKAPFKWGKTFLMHQILNYANCKQNYKVVRIDFKQADTNILIDSELLLRWLCSNISHEIDLEDKQDQYWRKTVGIKRNCTNYFTKYLLKSIECPLILGLDDVDLLFPYHKTAHDLFSLLRSWHEDAKIKLIWKKFRLILAYSREDYIPLHQNQSPFNVGKEVELQELNYKQVQNLTQIYKLNWNDVQINLLMGMVGGHPYLVNIAIKEIAANKFTLEEFLKIAPTEEGLYKSYLLRYLNHLQNNQQLLEAIKQVIMNDLPVKIDAKATSKLRDMGLVKSKANCVEPLCNLYRLYFRDRLEV